MHLIFSIITYNRLNFLKDLIESWKTTHDKSHDCTLIISDDRSTDGTKAYLESIEIDDAEVILISNPRKGVHHQINQVLKFCSQIKFDIGFMCEDDIKFTQEGWEDIYINPCVKYNYQHLVYFSEEWAKLHPWKTEYLSSPIIDSTKSIQSYVKNINRVYGCFWTFTPEIIKTVGYFDLQTFGLWHGGHIDYTKRCSKAGFNGPDYVFDALDSEKYIRMVTRGYRPSINESNRFSAGVYKVDKLNQLKVERMKDRVFVDYNELPYGMKEAIGN